MSMFDCQRCKSWSASEVKLAGDVEARLCVECRNEFRDVVEALPEWVRLEELELQVRGIEIAATGVKNPSDETGALHEEARAIYRGPVRAAATAFVQQSVTRAEAQSAPASKK